MENEIQELKFQVGEAWKGVYSSSTAYGLANVVQDATGLSIYRSLKSGNVGHPVSDRTWWFCIINMSSIKAESDRIAALNDAIARDEALRVTAEELRQQKEQQRTTAETQRNEAEQARISAEQSRVNAESARATAEQQRITAEQGRVSAESERVQAEQARVLAETLRANAEDQRVANEQNRVAAEQQRIERAEQDHQRAESDHAAYIDSLGAFDISSYHATDGVLAKYADLAAALGTNGANIPDDLRKGGMSVKFVQSSDNKYVQYRLVNQNWSTVVTDWQGVDDEPTAGSQNLVESGGVAKKFDEVEKVLTEEVLHFVEDITNQRNVGMKIITNTYSVGDVVDLTPVSQSNIDCLVVEVVKDELFIVTATGGTGPKSFTWTDKDKKFISTASSQETTLTDSIIQAPSDGFLILNGVNTFALSWKKIINTLDNGNKYRTSQGNITNLNKYLYTEPIKVNVKDVLYYPYEVSSQVAAITKVTADGDFISVLKAGIDGDIVGEYTFSEECYISISLISYRIDNVQLTLKGLVTSVGLLSAKSDIFEEEISSIQSDINVLDEKVDIEVSKIVNEDSGQNLLGTLIDDAVIENGNERYEDGYHATDFIEIKSGVSYYYNNVYRGFYAFYSKEKQILSYANTVSIDSPNRLALPFYAPANAKYVRLSILPAQDHANSWLNTRDEAPSGEPHIELTEAVINGTGLITKENSELTAITENPLKTIIRDASYAGIIHSWGIVGDSLASGEMQCYDTTSASVTDYKFIDMYQWSWGQRFARLNAVNCYNFSNGGQTTWGWLKEQGVVRDDTYVGGVGGGDWRQAQLSDNLKDGYIIALGVNDHSAINQGRYSLGDVDDIMTYTGNNDDIDDTSSAPKSFVRYYAGIIQRLKSVRPKCKIFCVTPVGSSYSEIAKAIRDIVEHFSGSDVYLVDLYTYFPIEWSGIYNMNGHGSAIGYEYVSYCINTYIDWIIRNNGNSFKATALIGLANYREKYSG